MLPLTDVRMQDVIRMQRPHPCGGTDWEVVRVGADIGLRCLTCDHRVLMERATLRKRAKAVVSRGPELDPAIERALYGDASPP
ncbi:MAG: DUF951 domain-containing protein [Dehalococcoidia bacterium]